MHPESRHELALQAVRRDTGRKSGVKSKGSRSAIQTSHNDEENSVPLLHRNGETSLERILENALQQDSHTLSVLSDNILRLPGTSTRKSHLLNLLGGIYWQRYQTLRAVDDLNATVTFHEEVAKCTAESDPMKAGYLNDFGASLLHRYERLGVLDDIKRSVEIFEQAIQLTPGTHSERPLRLTNLGNSLAHYFKHSNDVAIIDRAIRVQEDAMQLTLDGNPHKPARLSNLGNCLVRRFDRLGNSEDLDRGIVLLEDAVRLTPDSDSSMPIYQNNLASLLYRRFQQRGDSTDLDRSIMIGEVLVQLTPDDHPAKPGRLCNLGNYLLSRFKRFGDVSDIYRSISAQEQALVLTPDNHSDRISRLTNLGNAFTLRFERLGKPDDINTSIMRFEEAVNLSPEEHPDRLSCLCSLSRALARRFVRFGDLNDINRSIVLQQDALILTPHDHSAKLSRQSQFSTLLFLRFERLGDLADINDSIVMAEDAAQHTRDAHPTKSSYLDRLGNSLFARFEYLGDISDINRSISMFQYAVRLTKDDHPDKPSRLNNCGSALWSRFKRLGELNDINNAIKMHEKAVKLTVDGHPEKPSRLNNLGNSLARRFRRLGELADIDRSISSKENAIQLIPDSDPRLPVLLSSLGNSLIRRFEKVMDANDIEKSILVHEKALRLTQDDHNKASRLNNLAYSLSVRFEHFKSIEDIDKSIQLQEEALHIIPDDHPNKSLFLINLGNSHARRFDSCSNSKSLELAHRYFSMSAQSQTGSAAVRFRACSLWARYSQLFQPSSLLSAYKHAISLLPELAWLSLSFADRHHHLMEAGNVVRDAAAAAAQTGDFKTAVEWLEQARSVIWGQVLQLRSPVDDLRRQHPDLANRLVCLSRILEGAGIPEDELTTSTKQSSLEPNGNQYHQSAHEREQLLEKIRSLKGFDQFLLPKTISQLSSAAKNGPVVILNASILGCQAFIVTSDNEVQHVPLNGLTFSNALALRKSLHNLLMTLGRGTSHESDRLHAKRVPDDGRLSEPEAEFSRILSELWIHVVRPVLNSLNVPTGLEEVRHIWWCPTGHLSFLPIHAAGLYSSNQPFGSKLCDLVISSYTPTLSALMRTSRPEITRQHQLLTVALPSESRLPATLKELDCVEEYASEKFVVVRLLEGAATVKSVVKSMNESDWAHFACHGVQDISNPMKSALLLTAHSKLTLSEISKLSLPFADLAFLSACQTATGAEDLEEEAVHLAAGMLLAGYRSVIATMWSIMDNDAAQVAADVYQHLFKDSEPDPTHAAEALHLAVETLRDKNVSFFSWVPFVHLGA